MFRGLALSAFISAALIGSAVAQGQVSQSDEDACTPDVFRLCSAFIPNEPSIVACLQSKKRSLSPACHNVFFPRSAKTNLDTTPTASIPAPKKHKLLMHRHAAK